MIIGIIGPIASGKDTAANYFVKRYGFKKILMSNFLRQEAERRHIRVTRKILRKIQHELRKVHGEDYLINLAIKHIKEKDSRRGWQNVVIDGMRTPTQVVVAKDKLKAKIILVDAKPEIRYMRQKRRHRRGYSRTLEQFMHEEAIELATFDFHETVRHADFKIKNDGSIKELYRDIDKLTKKLKLKKKR